MRRAKPRRLRSNRRVERATAKTAFLAANASGGVHREAHRPCPMCSAGAGQEECALTIYVTSQPAQTLNQ